MIKGSGHEATMAHGDHRDAASCGVGRPEGIAGASSQSWPTTAHSEVDRGGKIQGSGCREWLLGAKLEVEAEDRWQAVWPFWGAVHTSCDIFG